MALLTSRIAFAKLPVHVNVTELDDALLIEIDLAVGAHDDAFAARFLDAYRTLLKTLAGGGDGPVGRLALVGEAARAQLLGALAGARSSASDGVLHALVAERAARDPHAWAATLGDERLTYGELDARADALARRLIALGAGLGANVAVALPRTPELLVALLGVLKTGAAYLPLDPSDPAARLAALVDDAGARIVVARDAGPFLALPVRIVPPEAGDHTAAVPVVVDVQPDDAAYVMYTSGSTGRPKGVVMTHRGVVNYLRWAVDAYAVERGRGAPLYSTVAFDLTVTSLFAPLLAGSAVAFVAPPLQGLGALYGAFELGGAFALMKTTPAHLALLLREPPRAGLAGQCGVLVVGGEQLAAEAVAPWRAAGVRVVNEYGPTEAAVGCCVYELNDADPASGPVPIGRPIPNTRLYVLDDAREPVPQGVAGELFVGGDGLARGYFGRPRETAERFVPDPYGGIPGARLYRTGDVVRLRPSGDLEYLGRRDRQVKVRGHRVELDEVERVVAGHAAVAQTAVMIDGEGEARRLVAYVVPAAGAVDEAALRLHTAAALPAAMVPAAFVSLDALPLTRNGKPDITALRRLAAAAAPATPPPPQPAGVAGGAEQRIAAIWAELLGRGGVDADARFFDLGGHSLQLPLLRDRLVQEFGREIVLLDLFRYPTVAGQARLVAAAPAVPTPGTVPAAPASAAAPAAPPRTEPIAIVGMAVRVPGAASADEPGSSSLRAVPRCARPLRAPTGCGAFARAGGSTASIFSTRSFSV